MTLLWHEDVIRKPYVQFIWDALGAANYPPPSSTDVQGEVAAYINHGRWVADCPSEKCGGALLISKDTPLFMCVYCANADNGGKWYDVTMPRDQRVIEAELLRRADVTKQNWKPGETVADLQAENALAGMA